jgi:hypothetical protein
LKNFRGVGALQERKNRAGLLQARIYAQRQAKCFNFCGLSMCIDEDPRLIQILHLEDSLPDRELVREFLVRGGIQSSSRRGFRRAHAADCDGCHNRSEFLCVTVRVFYIIGYQAWEQFGYLVSSNPLRMAGSFVRHGVRSKDEGQFRYR